MAAIRRPVRQAANAPHQIPCTSQARDLGNEWQEAKMWADSRITGKKYQHFPQGKARQKPGEDQQAAGGEVLPAEDWLLSYWPVPQVDEEQAHSQVLAVSV
jgi:hypothetical protein